MKKLSLARRRVVVMASGVTMLAAASALLERGLVGWLRVPAAWVVLPFVGLEAVAMAFVVNAFVRLKADEARDAAQSGDGEA